MPSWEVDNHRLLSLLFGAADSPEGLSEALAAIARELDAEKAHTFVLEDARTVSETCFHGYDSSGFGAYESHWRAQDPRFAAGLASPGRFHSDVDVIEPAAFERSAIYNDFLTTAGVRYTLFANFRVSSRLEAAQAFLRSRRKGPFGPEQVRFADELMPWVARTLRLRHLVRSLRDELDDLRRALDAAPGGLAVLDGAGQVVCANAAADRLFAARDGLMLVGRKLTAERASDAQRLAAALRTASTLAEPSALVARSGPTTLTSPLVRVARERGRPLDLLFLPLRPGGELRIRGDTAARVLAVLHDPDQVVALNVSLLMALHDFTPTEAALAAALAAGRSLAEYAAARGCSEQTARTHLKRLLQKTGTGRQAELVSFLLSSAALHHVQPA